MSVRERHAGMARQRDGEFNQYCDPAANHEPHQPGAAGCECFICLSGPGCTASPADNQARCCYSARNRRQEVRQQRGQAPVTARANG